MLLFNVRHHSEEGTHHVPWSLARLAPERFAVLLSLLSLYILILPVEINAQTADYETIFGENWNKAIAFEKENRVWMMPLIQENNLSYHEAIAVIFPELIRYSALRDMMEITLLKSLYVSLGTKYSNFSIGQFQIKPSFAELVRVHSPPLTINDSIFVFSKPLDYSNLYEYRRDIVTGLENPETEIIYLIAFIKICNEKYKLSGYDDQERVKFLSTAYNYGIDNSKRQIEKMVDRRFFSTKLISDTTYSYSDISVTWYRQNIDVIK